MLNQSVFYSYLFYYKIINVVKVKLVKHKIVTQLCKNVTQFPVRKWIHFFQIYKESRNINSSGIG